MENDKKLFLLDAYALIYRAFFAFSKNPRVNSKGFNTSAIYGFTNTLFEIIRKEKPTHLGVCFDVSGPTDRHIEFVEYKANREAMPEDIRASIPIIKDMLANGFNIPVLEYEGYEADDVIGTLAKKAEKEGYQTYMVTPDKDYGQLVSDNIFMYKPAYKGNGFDVLGPKEICKKWDIEDPLTVIDILAMMGDSADNIPGIPGVGEKTAIKLLKEYGTLENVLENGHKIKGKLGEKIRDNIEMAKVCKMLTTIILDVPVEFHHEDLFIGEMNNEKLSEIFNELEFRTLGKRILGDDFKVDMGQAQGAGSPQMDLFGGGGTAIATPEPVVDVEPLKTIDNTDHQYYYIENQQGCEGIVNLLLAQKSVCFDTETTSIDPHNTELVGMSFSFEKGKAFYVSIPEDQEEAKKMVNVFKPFFESDKVEKIAHNIKFDMEVLKWYGVEVKAPTFDTMVAHYLIEPEQRHGMDSLAERFLRYQPVAIESLIGKKGKNQLSMRDVDVQKIKEYAGEDADITYQLKDKFQPELGTHNADKLFKDIESPLVHVLTDMECEGVHIDEKALEDYSKELQTDIEATEKRIYETAGVEFNIASPRQLGEVLFDKMEIPYSGKKTKTGQYSTNEETLQKLAQDHEIVKDIMDFRQFNKLKSTYVDALPKLVNPKTGRIHSSFNQTVAATGRLSSTNPNLQNIPIRTEKGREVRKAFIPRGKDYTLLSADYSQIELRLVAEVSKDPAMVEAFKNGLDIHTATASKVFHVPIEEVTREMRSKAKTVNFGIIYGISAFGLSQRMGIKRKEAKEIIDSYFDKYPGVKESMDNAINFAREHGYVETLLGRRRYLRDINSNNATVRGFAERNAINSPLQGTAADMIKIAMINIHEEFKKQNLKSRMILQVHDELVFDAHKDELDIIKPIIEEKMVNAIETEVPMLVEMGTGENWLEAH